VTASSVDTDLGRGVDEYLVSLSAERSLSPHTVAAYRRDLAQYLAYLDNAASSRRLVEEFVQSLSARGLVPASIARKLAAIRGLHSFLVGEGLAAEDPTQTVDLPRRLAPLPKALMVDEAIALVEAPDRTTVKGRRDAAILEFLYGTGARVTEAVGLDLEALDLVEHTARLTGKGGRQRLVPLGSAARSAIEAWLPDRLNLRRPGRDDGAVFLNIRGRRLTRQAVFDIVRTAAGKAGIPVERVSPHVLRHSAATHMVEGGADLRTVQEMLGHATISTTQVYTRVSPQHLLEVFVSAHPRSR
jgi:integrase/recombinase XerD